MLVSMKTGILSLLVIPKSRGRAEEERRVRNLFVFVVIVQISNLQTVSIPLTRNSMNLLPCHQVQSRRVNLNSTAHPKIGMNIKTKSRPTTNQMNPPGSDTARFNVLIIGTLFPLGPSQDAVHVLTSMGGPIGDAGKWTIDPELRRALVRILDPTPARKLRRGLEKIE